MLQTKNKFFSPITKKHGIRFVFRVFLVVDMGCGLNERSEVEVRGRVATKGATQLRLLSLFIRYR